MNKVNSLKKLELLGAGIVLYIDSYFTLKESQRNILDHYYQDSEDGIELDIKLFAKEVESLNNNTINYDEDEIKHSLKRFKYYLSKIENYRKIGIDKKKLNTWDLINFINALKDIIGLCEETLNFYSDKNIKYTKII